jgi:hypothetical protein
MKKLGIERQATQEEIDGAGDNVMQQFARSARSHF